MKCYYCHGYGKTTYATINGGIRPIHEKCLAHVRNKKWVKASHITKRNVIKVLPTTTVPRCTLEKHIDGSCPYFKENRPDFFGATVFR